MTLLRLADDPKDKYHRLSRQNILLFIILAAWCHLCVFQGIESLGFNFLTTPLIPEEGISLPLELELEINPEALDMEIPQNPMYDSGTGLTLPQETPPTATLEELIVPDVEEGIPSPALIPEPEQLERALSPEEILDPMDNQLKTFSFANNSQIIGDDEFEETIDNTINVEESAPRLKNYDSQVRTAVARHWILPPSARTNFQPGRFSATMTINSQGEILSIVVRESAGSTPLDYAAIEALRGAAPYPPFPEELSHLSHRSFLMHFDYRAVIRNQGTSQKPGN